MKKNKLITRRSFIKNAAIASSSLAFPSILKAGSPTTLTMLAWYGQAEPDAVEEFERLYNVKIIPKYYVGGEQMIALLAQSPPGTYDIIHADAEYVQQLAAANFLEKLDAEDYPFDDFYSEFQNFPGHWIGKDLYAVISRFGFLGISHNLDVVSVKEASSYKLLWDKKLKNRVGHFDWHLPNLGALSLLNGNSSPYSINKTSWNNLKKTTLSLKPQIRGFYDYGGVLSSLKNGEVSVIPGIGEWITGVLRRDGANVTTTIPEEGGIQFTESFSIGKNSRKAELARKFIQYMAGEKGQYRLANLNVFPAIIPSKKGWKRMIAEKPMEAKHLGMFNGSGNAIDLIQRGRIHIRELPHQQSLEDWNDFWSEYKGS
ncbi:polyamine ABC transporter substrate-binding protein [Pelagibaculum spongiae]|uniref:ABC transporter substrate-binding protein n=1 Tax=Pelagibaculum spongiae TaxID=2080658 RepID=A0A2V1H159_9GAMM|nr:spermidine/putrescine ABC transporter substrate-binding protein [Pelagibaculum spongiae]PVZ70162.1 ABC transporter substrate-binding protein [Pelagibaculum spongiae]